MNMRKAFISSFSIVSACTLLACTSTPDVNVSYYLPRAVTQVQVMQSFVCPSGKSSGQLSVTAAVTATTSYVADYRAGLQYLSYGGYSTPFSDIDLTITRSPDKRLLGINSSTVGEGSTILQDIISLGTTIAKFAGAGAKVNPKHPVGPGREATGGPNPCNVVRSHFTGDASKTPPSVSLTYTANIIYGDPADASATMQTPTMIPLAIDPETTATSSGNQVAFSPSVALMVDPGSSGLQQELKAALLGEGDPFSFRLTAGSAYKLADDAVWAGAHAASPGNAVKLRQTFNTDLELHGPTLQNSSFVDSSLWRGAVLVPTSATYLVPLPTPELFGKNQFTLALTDAGVITKLEYGTTSGAADAIGTATAAVKAAEPASDEEIASKYQGHADKIYQQNRDSECIKSPSACTSK